MSKDRNLIAFRPKADGVDVSPILDDMERKGIGKSHSDRIRITLVEYGNMMKGAKA